MFLMTSLLRKRLFIGYFITGFIVLSMVTVMINERCRLKELENLIIQINEAYENTNLKSATPFPKCYLHKEKWTFDS